MHFGKEERNFQKIKGKAEAYYGSIREVHCPYLNVSVNFNEKGWKHLRFKENRQARSQADQLARFKHLRFASRILEKSRTLQEFRQANRLEKARAGGNTALTLQVVRYFGFIAIIMDGNDMKRFKVIVKQVRDGSPYFWSIIPFWRSKNDFKMHTGDLEMD